MKLVNDSLQMLHISDSSIVPGATTGTLPGTSRVLRWLPLMLVVTAVAAAGLLGSPNKSRDELDWLSQLANNGDAGAQLQLGLAYRDGRYGLTPDAKTGLYWLKQSANAGNAYAEDAIGSAYAKGQGTTRDEKQAEQWWRKAIKDGNANARIHLADALIKSGQTREGNRLFM
jgi:TPR repeat protein